MWNPGTGKMMKENDHIRRTREGNQQKQTRDSKENSWHILCIRINRNEERAGRRKTIGNAKEINEEEEKHNINHKK